MGCEIVGVCTSCLNSKNPACVDIYVSRNKAGEITNMYIFGDDHFDVPASNQSILDFSVSEDGKTITEVVCPRCKERIAVSVPVIANVSNKSNNSDMEKYAAEKGE